MNLNVLPFVELAAKRAEQVQRLQLIICNMIKIHPKLKIGPEQVDILTHLLDACESFIVALLSASNTCLVDAPDPTSPNRDGEEVPLSFPGFAHPGGDTPPDQAG